MAVELPELIVRDAAAWRVFLGKHHADPAGVWLVLAKKGTEEPTSLTYDQALEEALCHGWIDGQARRRDETTYRQRFTPRRRRSSWSKRNTGHAERLLAEGRMHPAGVAEVERAKADGRWDAAYAGPAEIEVPPDLAEAARTVTQSCTESPPPSGQTPARAGSRNSWRCSAVARRFIRRRAPSGSDADRRRPQKAPIDAVTPMRKGSRRRSDHCGGRQDREEIAVVECIAPAVGEVLRIEP